MDTATEQPVSTGNPTKPLSADPSAVRLPLLPAFPVPPLWQRIHHIRSVYYISPSGRVLLDRDDVDLYLQQKNTCKCQLRADALFNDVFNFDPRRRSAPAPTNTNQAAVGNLLPDCTDWLSRQDTRSMRVHLWRTINYLAEMEVVKLEQAYALMNRTKHVDHLTLEQWLHYFDWERIRVMADGRMLSMNISRNQLPHLARELALNGELEDLDCFEKENG